MSSLTLAEIQSVLDSLTPKLYYGVSDTCAKGQYYFVKETRWNPQFIIVHPDDLETLRELVYPAQLVHLPEHYKPITPVEPIGYLEHGSNILSASWQLPERLL